MQQLKNIAEKHRCSMLLIRHLNKGAGKALYRGQGSVDFTAAARSVLVVAESLEDDTKKVMAHEKASLQRKGASQVFQLTNEGFYWCGTSKVNAEDLVSQAPRKTAHQQHAAAEWLAQTLDRTERLANMIYAEAEANGISRRTLERAKTQLKVMSFQKENKWYWKLPDGWDLDPDDDPIPFD
jgi:RecA-family ATPase